MIKILEILKLLPTRIRIQLFIIPGAVRRIFVKYPNHNAG